MIGPVTRFQTHLVPHRSMAPAEQQPRPNLDPRVARAEDDGRLYLRKRLLVHARPLQQLAQVEPGGEVVESEQSVVVEERCSGLGAVAEKRVKVECAVGRNQPSHVLVH